MSTILKLQRALAPNVTTNLADVLAAKTFLQGQGFYDAPEWGVTEYPDRALFSAIEAFQKSKGLRVDGLMKPGGETEMASQLIQAQALDVQSMGRNGDTILAHITPAEAALLHDVTDGGSINPKTGLMEFYFGEDNDSQFGDVSAAAQSNDQAAENEAQHSADFSGRESGGYRRTVDFVNDRRNEENAKSIERAEAKQAQAREIARQKKEDEDKRQKEKELKAEEDRQRRVAELQKKEEEEENKKGKVTFRDVQNAELAMQSVQRLRNKIQQELEDANRVANTFSRAGDKAVKEGVVGVAVGAATGGGVGATTSAFTSTVEAVSSYSSYSKQMKTIPDIKARLERAESDLDKERATLERYRDAYSQGEGSF
ncbi:MAG: hypothetical protein COB46_11445 [Rhodospirillaceae bacterium]|nr:MAG: hypothetical protein COB46_11445 [Rhodospirillaceae bacterium]